MNENGYPREAMQKITYTRNDNGKITYTLAYKTLIIADTTENKYMRGFIED